jgi:hypothetical protein
MLILVFWNLMLSAALSGKVTGTLAVVYRASALRACNAHGNVPAAQGNARASACEKATITL